MTILRRGEETVGTVLLLALFLAMPFIGQRLGRNQASLDLLSTCTNGLRSLLRWSATMCEPLDALIATQPGIYFHHGKKIVIK